MRKLSRKHWSMSFYKWAQNTRYTLNGRRVWSDRHCGYCVAAVAEDPDNCCDECLLNKAVCNYDGNSGHFAKWGREITGGSVKSALKYARLILKATVKDGRKWGYMTPKREETYKLLMGG